MKINLTVNTTHMNKTLLTPGSILELAMRRCVLGKDTFYTYFPLRPSSLPVAAAQHDAKLANRTPKSALRWCGYAECLVHTDERTQRSIHNREESE